MSKTTKGKAAAVERGSILTSVTPPWPVWSDATLNAEKWDAVIPGAEREKTTPSIEFEDPAGHGELPATLVAAEWIRAPKLFPKVTVVADVNINPCNFFRMNLHLIKSQLMRTLIADISSLMHLAQVKPFPIEMQGTNFSANGGNVWKPWHHVYSVCKAGKGESHDPGVNPVGKYIIRLFYLGFWRRLIVDDYMPVDECGKLLLPVTPEEEELWLPLLAKALLRIASLSWSAKCELVDFSVVTCLTGWLPQSFSCSDIPVKYIWYIFQKFIMSEVDDEKKKYIGIPQEAESRRWYDPPAAEGLTIKNPLYEMKTSEELEVLGPVVMFAMCVPGKLPYSGQSILITDANVHEVNDGLPMPLWKQFRWKEWAVKKGLIEDKEQEIKLVKVFVPMNVSEISQDNGHKPNEPEARTYLPSTVEEATRKIRTKMSSNKEKNNEPKKSIKRRISVSSEEEFNKDFEKWLDLRELIQHLDTLTIYYRPSCFANKFTTSDMSLLGGRDDKQVQNTSTSAKDRSERSDSCIALSSLRECLHHSFCLHIDSIYSKKILITFSVLSEATRSRMSTPSKSERTAGMPGNVQSYHVIGEDYIWTASSFGHVLFCIASEGTKTTLLQLPENASTIRIWLKIPQHFSLSIMSQAPFSVGPLEKIQLLCNVSASLSYYGESMAQSFARLTETEAKFSVEEFHTCYLPKNLSWTPEHIQPVFEKAVVSTLLCRAGNDLDVFRDSLRNLQELLLKPSFGTEALSQMDAKIADAVYTKANESQPEYETEHLKHNKQGSKITSHKKGKEKKYTVNLCNVFDTPESCAEVLVRMTKISPSILQLYPFRDDLKKRMVYNEYRGEMKPSRRVPSDGWQLIMRFIVNTHSEESCFGAFYFIISLKSFVFRVINNDTLEEFPRCPIGTLPFPYTKNKNGYTVIAYGMFDSIAEKEAKWCLRIISYETKCLLHRCPSFEDISAQCIHLSPTEVVIKELRGYYIPSSECRICRCILTTAHRQLLSLRFHLSNDKARFHFTVTEMSSHETAIERRGMGTLLIPAFHLETFEHDIKLPAGDFTDEPVQDRKLTLGKDSEPEEALLVFVVEAFVIRESWQLTEEEKEKVKMLSIRQRGTIASENRRTSSSDRQRRRSSNRSDFVNDLPCWSLQVVVDADKSTETILERDTQREQQIREMKVKWEEADPGRHKTACSLRSNFLEERKKTTESATKIQRRKSSPDFPQTTSIESVMDQILKPCGEKVVDTDYTDCLKVSVQKSLESFEQLKIRMNKQLKRVLWNKQHRNELLVNNLSKKRGASEQLSNAAYTSRTLYIQKELDAVKNSSVRKAPKKQKR